MIVVFTENASGKPLKDKKGETFLNAFIDIINESNPKPNNYGLIKEKSFITILYKNCYIIIIF